MNSDQQYRIDEDPSSYCQSTLKSLTTGQKQICLLHADHMPIVTQGTIFFFVDIKSNYSLFCIGASKAIDECQSQFQDRHWNCSIVRDGSVFGPLLHHGTFHIFLLDKI
jgi:hypothetical protein